MELTPDQALKLRLLSDGKLYKDAVKFIEDNGTIKNAQVSGLESIAESAVGFSQISKFINHQAQKKRYYSPFYSSLGKYLTQISNSIKFDRDFIPEDLTGKKLKKHTEFYGLLFARELIHHLTAENRFKKEEE